MQRQLDRFLQQNLKPIPGDWKFKPHKLHCWVAVAKGGGGGGRSAAPPTLSRILRGACWPTPGPPKLRQRPTKSATHRPERNDTVRGECWLARLPSWLVVDCNTETGESLP